MIRAACHKIVTGPPEVAGTIVASIRATGGGAMDQRVFIAQLNIEHYRQKLLSENDGATRRQITHLLAEEEAKLAAFSDPLGNPKEKR
jgi:hypothetical protein